MKSEKKFLPIITLILGLFLGSILIFLLDDRFDNISPEEAGKKVKEVYELATGTSIEIISVRRENKMYKVIAKVTDFLGQTSILEVFLSLDGKLMSERTVKLDEFKTDLENQKIFIDCLGEKGLKIYGLSNDTATQLQLVQILGGSRFLNKIYVNCAGANLRTCFDVGIITIPSVVYQGKFYEGIKTIEWFEEKTGCRLERG